MNAVVDEPHVIHVTPGRVRIHVPAWSPHRQAAIEARLGRVAGVRHVEANALIGNVLIHFDASATDPGTLVAVLRGTRSNGHTRRAAIRSERRAVARLPSVEASVPSYAVRTMMGPDAVGLLHRLCVIIGAGAGLMGLLFSGSILGTLAGAAELLHLCGEMLAWRAQRQPYPAYAVYQVQVCTCQSVRQPLLSPASGF